MTDMVHATDSRCLGGHRTDGESAAFLVVMQPAAEVVDAGGPAGTLEPIDETQRIEHGLCGALASSRFHGVHGIAEQGDPPGAPAFHASEGEYGME
jgi:hypothetical protein